MENETEEKQNYLRSKILEAGYDTEKFVQLLQSKKGEEAADLDLWTFDELKAVNNSIYIMKIKYFLYQVVNEFIRSQTAGLTERSNSVSSYEKDLGESAM